jgi:RNA polymerase sigma factor (sigma-70 family)
VAYTRNKKDYAKLFPGVEIDPVILKALKQGDRKEDYFMVVLKRDRYLKDRNGNYVRDKNGQTIKLPEREVSLEKLCDENWDYPSSEPSPEQRVIAEVEYEELHRCIRSLPTDEKKIIYGLFFSNDGEGMSVREYAKLSGIPFTTIQSRKQKALTNLKKLLGGS